MKYWHKAKNYSVPIIILVFVIIHRLATLPKLNWLASDPRNIACFALGMDFAGYFNGDPLVGNPEIYSWYTPVYVFVIRKLAMLFKGNYFLAFWSQIDLTMLLFALGCYLFGRDFIGGKRYGIVFLLLNLPFIPAPIGGGWGIPLHQTRPAVLFISVLPLILWQCYKINNRGKWKVTNYILLASLTYIHPVSAVFWVFCIWSAGWLSQDGVLSLKVRWMEQIKSLVIVVVVMIPFVYIFLFRNVNLTGSIPYDELMIIAKYRLNDLYFDPLQIPIEFWKKFPVALQVILVTFPIQYIIIRKNFRWKANILLIWIFCLIISCTVFTYIDWYFSSYWKTFPRLLDLNRNYIFTPFILYVTVLLFFVSIEESFKKANRDIKGLAYVGLFSAIVWVGVYYYPSSLDPLLRSWLRGEVYMRPVTQQNNFGGTLVKAVSLPKEIIADFPGNSAASFVRYEGKRPLVYCYKDGGTFLYGDHGRVMTWYQTALQIKKLRKIVSWDVAGGHKSNALTNWARSHGARYLLLNTRMDVDFDFGQLRTVQCHGYTLVDLGVEYEVEGIERKGNSWSIETKGNAIDLLSFEQLPDWIRRGNGWDGAVVKETDERDISISVEGNGSERNLSYILKSEPGRIYALTAWVYYETNDEDFSVVIGKCEATLYGGRVFNDGNRLLSEPGRWKKHEAIILIPREIKPDSLEINWNLVNFKGEGRVIVKNPKVQYLGDFPLEDGLEINSDFGAFKESNKLHYRRNS